MSSKYIYNNSGAEKTYRGLSFPNSAFTLIPGWAERDISQDSSVLSDIANSVISISTDGSTVITSVYNQIAALSNSLTPLVESVQQSFTSKILTNGKKLYKREYGQQYAVTTGSNDLLFTIPFPWVKLTGLCIVGGELLDTGSLYVLDSTSGTYTTVPNYVLNQFGYSVNISAGEYIENCRYDADLYTGMQIKLVYTSISSKTIGINFSLNEVKD